MGRRVIPPIYREIIDCVINAACQYYEVSRDQLINDSSSSLVNARHLCFYIIIKSTVGVKDIDIGLFFNRGRTAVNYGIDQIDLHLNIYRQTLDSLNHLIDIANNFEKKYPWDLPKINITR